MSSDVSPPVSSGGSRPSPAPPPPPVELGKVLTRVGLVVAVGAVLTALLSWALWTRVEAARANQSVLASPAWLLLAGLVWTFALVFQALRWRALLPRQPSPGAMAGIVVGTNLLNLVMPGPTGELVAAWLLHRSAGTPLVLAAVTSVLARLLALVVLGALVLLGWPLVAPETPSRWLQAAVLGAGAAAAALAVLWMAPGKVDAGLRAATGVLPIRWQERLLASSAWWGDGLASLGSLGPARWAEAAGWSALNALVLGASTWCAFVATGTVPSHLPLLYTHLLASLAVVTSLVVPGGVGAVDAVFVGVLPAIGGPGPVEAAFGVLALRQAQLVSMLCSVPALVWVVRRAAQGSEPPAAA